MIVKRLCPMCGFVTGKDLNVTQEQLDRYNNTRALVQDVFPDLNATEREFIITGYCDDCQEILFAEPEE